jgi:hypothetical protein
MSSLVISLIDWISLQILNKILILLFLAISLEATPNFQVDRSYPNLGLRMKTLASSNPEPLSQLTIYTYVYTKGNESKKVNMYDPFEIWYMDQHKGQWRDKNGNLFIIAQPKNLRPYFNSKHILVEHYQKAIDSGKFDIDMNRTTSLKAWVEDFAQVGVTKFEPTKARSFALQKSTFISTTDPNTLVYTFTLKPKVLNKTPETYVAILKIFDNSSPLKTRQNFENQFLKTIKTIPEKSSYPKNYTVGTRNKKTEDKGTSAVVEESIENMDGWWSQRVDDYIFITDLKDYNGKKLITFLQYTMPAIRKAFQKAIPPLKPISDTSVIRIFEKPSGYRNHLDIIGQWTSGVWQPSKRELTVLYQKKDQDKTIEVIVHEGLHQYMFYATDMISTSPWFNEGFACFFQTAQVVDRGRRVLVPEQKKFATFVYKNKEIVANHIPALLTKSYEQFYEPNTRQLNYATAWSIIYFLQKDRSTTHKLYEHIIPKYLKALQQEKDFNKATAIAFRNINIDTFKEDFIRFWEKQRFKANRYTPFSKL